MTRQFLEALDKYFQTKTAPTDQEKELIAQLKKETETFWIAFIDRDTLIRNGYDADGLSDDDMDEITGMIGDSYCGCSKFDNDIIEACEQYGVAKAQTCPRCEFDSAAKEPSGQHYRCRRCGCTWSTNYVLIEFPDDTSYFEDNGIGYPSFESEDNGARYVPEYDYIRHFKKDPAPNSCFRPLRWPESQPYLFPDEPNDAIDTLNEPIGDEKGIADFGEQAVWVPLCNLKNR